MVKQTKREVGQTLKNELLRKNNSFQALTIFAKSSILDIWQRSEYLFKKQHPSQILTNVICIDILKVLIHFRSYWISKNAPNFYKILRYYHSEALAF